MKLKWYGDRQNDKKMGDLGSKNIHSRIDKKLKNNKRPQALTVTGVS